MKKIIIYKPLIAILWVLLLGAQMQANNVTRPNISFYGGLAVNSYSGNLFFQRNDLKLAGSGPSVDLTFAFNSSHRHDDQGFGLGWTFSHNMYYFPDSQGVWLSMSTGKRHLFVENAGAYAAPPGVFDCFETYGPGLWRLSTPSGMIYYFEDSTHKHLTRIKDPSGNEVSLSYQNGKVTEIVNATGRKIRFVWQNNHLLRVQDISSLPARNWEYSYSNSGQLLSVKNPLAHIQNYGYDQDGKLISIRLYDDNQLFIGYHKGEVVAEIASCDFHDYFTYEREANKTFHIKETDDGSIIDTYVFDEDGNLIQKKGSCCGYDMGYTYDGDLNITEIVNGEGKVVSYSFDALGNRTSTTDPSGNTSFTTYVSGTTRIASIQDRRGNTKAFTYDSDGNVVRIDYPLGIQENFSYDSRGLLKSHTDGEGNTRYFEYDSLGNLLCVKAPLGVSMRRIYDTRGNKIEEIDARGHSVYYEYDLLDRLIKLTDHLGYSYRYRYDSNGRLLSEINPLGDSVNYTYDPLGRLLAESYPQGVTYRFKYNKRGNLIARIDPMGREWRYRYNSRNQKVAEIDPLGNTTRFAYNGIGKQINEIDPLGNVSSFVYDDAGRQIQSTNSVGELFQSSFNEVGQKISTTDPLGNITQFEYDALGRLIKKTDPLGNVSHTFYNKNHKPIIKLDPLGRKTEYLYDSLMRVVAIIDPAGDSVRFKYDKMDNLIAWILPNGDSTSWEYNEQDLPIIERNMQGYETKAFYNPLQWQVRSETAGGNRKHYVYDKLGRLIEMRDTLGVLEKRSYDLNGNLIQQETQWGQVYTYSYDVLNRKVRMIDPEGEEQRYMYDALGKIIAIIDRRGNSQQFSYDSEGRVLEEIDELGNKVSYSYNTRGEISQIVDPSGRSTRFNYDAAGRKISEVLPDNSQAIFSYDVAGQLSSTTTRNGQKIQFDYDLKGQLIKKSYPNNREDFFQYDQNGSLISAINPWATVSYTYDELGRKKSESCRNKTTNIDFGAGTRSTEIIYPSGRKIVENSDIRGRLENIQEGANTLASFTYNQNDRPTSIVFGNGLEEKISYNNFTKIREIEQDSLFTLKYDYDSEGYILSEENLRWGAFSRTFSYDPSGSITAAKRGTITNGQINLPTDTWQYSHDANGNRTHSQFNGASTSYQVDFKNAYTRVGTQNMSLDMQGNLLNDGTYQYDYDADNKLIEVKQSGNSLISYRYDALGRRTQRMSPTDTVYYYYCLNEIIEERDARDSVIATYVYGIGIDDIIQAEIQGQNYYYHRDWQGSVRAISNDQGQAVEYYEYDPFGKQSVFNAQHQQIVSSQIGNPYGFTGRRHESGSHLIYYRSRTYHADLGRFLQPDPAGYIDGPNMYRYALNSPTNHRDPFGLFIDNFPEGFNVKEWWDNLFKLRFAPSVSLEGLSVTFLSIPLGPGIFSITAALHGTIGPCCDPYYNEINVDVNAGFSIGVEYALGLGQDFREKKDALDQIKKARKKKEHNDRDDIKRELRREKYQGDHNELQKKIQDLDTEHPNLGKKDRRQKINKLKREQFWDKVDNIYDEANPNKAFKEYMEDFKKNNVKSDVELYADIDILAVDLPTCPIVQDYLLDWSGSFRLDLDFTAGFAGFGAELKLSATFDANEPFYFKRSATFNYGLISYVGLKVALSATGRFNIRGVYASRIKPGTFPF